MIMCMKFGTSDNNFTFIILRGNFCHEIGILVQEIKWGKLY